MKIITLLAGKKTYICAIGIGIISAAKFLGWIDEATFGVLFALLTGGSIASLRAQKPAAQLQQPITRNL